MVSFNNTNGYTRNTGGQDLVMHSKSTDEIVDLFSSNIEKGLSSEQVSLAQNKYGLNKLREKKKKSMLARFFDQFKDVMILIRLLLLLFRL